MSSTASRRNFLGLAAGLAFGGMVPTVRASETNRWATALDATDAIAGVRNGDFTAERYITAMMKHAKASRNLDLFISTNEPGVLASAYALDRKRKSGQALGELAGIPLLVKDNIEAAGLPTTAGTPALHNYRPEKNAPALAALLGADALLFGKSNMHEMAMGVTSNNGEFGAVRNPYDPSRIPGGSSGGTAAGIAARVSPLGLGTDTGGSGRIPASLCGICGFRPSLGRYPAGGVVPSSHTRDTIAPMGRTVADVDLLDRVLTGRAKTPTLALRQIRLGLPTEYFWDGSSPDVLAVANETVARLKEYGCTFVEVKLNGLTDLLDKITPILIHEVIADLSQFLQVNEIQLTVPQLVSKIKSPDVAAIYKAFLAAGDVGPAYRQAVDVFRPQLQALYAKCFRENGIDALFFPATPVTAPLIGADYLSVGSTSVPVMQTFFHDDNPASAAGLPALVVPAGLVAIGLPVGMELDGPLGSDTRLLAIGRAIEVILGPMPAPTHFV